MWRASRSRRWPRRPGWAATCGSSSAGSRWEGSERSGPLAARPELFDGRPWALCPAEGADPAAVEAVTSLVTGCGATPVRIDAAGHDRTMALVSHAPHVVSSAMAARFADAPEGMVGLAGQGARDVTRIAGRCAGALAGDPGGQCRPVADVIEAVSDDLARVASALRARARRGAGGRRAAGTGRHRPRPDSGQARRIGRSAHDRHRPRRRPPRRARPHPPGRRGRGDQHRGRLDRASAGTAGRRGGTVGGSGIGSAPDRRTSRPRMVSS
ncbi:prephenate dehydrogenase/arogenate dehydrogenase family protein [Actinomadura madurae]|uniref:prephenate dehydrogenase/arogenate dehydrogenase family protein n=1 Tax=Actinomadura madurae TaxID=1993 RepID=UPI0027E22872|nr:prephenate dehydrogenase/arogenate dehydrogenase family protein [Actinomadura madurae]